MKKLLSILLCAAILLPLFNVTGWSSTSYAEGAPAPAEKRKDAMSDVREAFDPTYKCGDTVRLGSDGYLGIPVEISVYHDKTVPVVTGMRGTPLIVYVINTSLERVGTKSDVEIIQGMLDRGYIVTVLDYLNSEKAVAQGLDFAVQKLWARVRAGEFFDGAIIKKGVTYQYLESFMVPEGCDIELNLPYWSFDLHGADGSLEKIVEVWNNDFKSWWGETIVYWLDSAGNRKKTTSDAVWEDASHIRVKYTIAETIYDVVQKDGSPIDLNLYMFIVYPTSPENDVPVYVAASSSEGLADHWYWNPDRAFYNRFAMTGYAVVAYDYAYNPLSRMDHYNYFDGNHPAQGSVTGDNSTYSLSVYNEKLNNPAAIRYIRYLGATQHEKFAFLDDKIGLIGGSKAGPLTYLGEPDASKMAPARTFPGHHGETRYDNGLVEDDSFGIIRGGTEQPWLTYPDGTPISCRINFCYTNVGSQSEVVSEDHCPTYVTGSMAEGHEGYYTNLVVGCKNGDTPCLYFEVPGLGHAMAKGPDKDYGIETYDIFFPFADYYLKGAPAQVVYVSTEAFGKQNIKTTDSVTVKFTGVISAEEIEKVTIVSSLTGKAAGGTWSSTFGGTEWTFTPYGFEGGAVYTLTVPDTIVDVNNGKTLAGSHVAVFTTDFEKTVSAKSVSGAKTVTTDEGTFLVFDEIDFSGSPEASLRFFVENGASNTALVYSAEFNADHPEQSYIGDYLGEVAVTGRGFYELDLSAHIDSLTAKHTVAFFIKAQKTVGNFKVSTYDFEGGKPSEITLTNYAVGDTSYDRNSTPSGKRSLKIEYIDTNDGVFPNKYTANGKYTDNKFVHANATSAFVTIKDSFLGKRTVTADDLGRRFHVSFKIYDTTSRRVRIDISSATDGDTVDLNAFFTIITTEADTWNTVEFDYVLLDPLCGSHGVGKEKTMTISFEHIAGDRSVLEGKTKCQNPYLPIYFDDFSITEDVTALEISSGERMPTIVYHPTDDSKTVDMTVDKLDGTTLLYTAKADKNADFSRLSIAGDGETGYVVYALTEAFDDRWNSHLFGNAALLSQKKGTGTAILDVSEYVSSLSDGTARFLVLCDKTVRNLPAFELGTYYDGTYYYSSDADGFSFADALADVTEAMTAHPGNPVHLSLGCMVNYEGKVVVPDGATLVIETNGFPLKTAGFEVGAGAELTVKGSYDRTWKFSYPKESELLIGLDTKTTEVRPSLHVFTCETGKDKDGNDVLKVTLPDHVRSVNGKIFSARDFKNGACVYEVTLPSGREEVPLVVTYLSRGNTYSLSCTVLINELKAGAQG